MPRFATLATDAAAFVARYMKGALHSPPAENCFTARGSLWKGADAPFEMAWVQYHSPLFPAVSAVAAFETYVQRLHGNLSHCSAYNWDHYMDYKAGLLFDNCAGILARLEQDGVPYFLVPHSDFYGVHMQAPGGTMSGLELRQLPKPRLHRSTFDRLRLITSSRCFVNEHRWFWQPGRVLPVLSLT